MCIRDRVEVVTDSNQSLDCLKALCSKYPVEQGIVATVIDLSERILADLAAFCLLYTSSVGMDDITDLLALTYYAGNYAHKSVQECAMEIPVSYTHLLSRYRASLSDHETFPTNG